MDEQDRLGEEDDGPVADGLQQALEGGDVPAEERVGLPDDDAAGGVGVVEGLVDPGQVGGPSGGELRPGPGLGAGAVVGPTTWAVEKVTPPCDQRAFSGASGSCRSTVRVREPRERSVAKNTRRSAASRA
jgi:hypothetical protein